MPTITSILVRSSSVAPKSSDTSQTPKEVRFVELPNVHVFQNDLKEMAERARHWRQINSTAQRRQRAARIKTQMVEFIDLIDSAKDAPVPESYSRNAVRARDLAKNIATSALPYVELCNLATTFQELTAEWLDLSTSEAQDEFADRFTTFDALVKDTIAKCPKDDATGELAGLLQNIPKHLTLPSFSASPSQDVLKWTKRFLVRHPPEHKRGGKTPSEWLRTWHSMLDGAALEWANTDAIVTNVMIEEVLAEATWHTVEIVVGMFMNRFEKKVKKS